MSKPIRTNMCVCGVCVCVCVCVCVYTHYIQPMCVCYVCLITDIIMPFMLLVRSVHTLTHTHTHTQFTPVFFTAFDILFSNFVIFFIFNRRFPYNIIVIIIITTVFFSGFLKNVVCVCVCVCVCTYVSATHVYVRYTLTHNRRHTKHFLLPTLSFNARSVHILGCVCSTHCISDT